MIKFGKWLGGGLGWAIGGPIGGLIGFAVGAIFDQVQVSVTTGQPGADRMHDPFRYNPATAQGDFIMSLVVLSAAVMKSDGRTMKSEVEYVKKFLAAQFGPDHVQELMLVLRDVLQKDIPLQEVCGQIRHYMPHAQRLQLLHYLFGISKADGHVHELELETIHGIAGHLGVSEADFGSLKAMYFRDVNADYEILEISVTATDDEVKKAYRRMAVKYHPDKVIDLGEEAQKAAKEKFQNVQRAYESVKKQRGFN